MRNSWWRFPKRRVSSRPAVSRDRRPRVEWLEDRTAPAVGFGFAVGVGGSGDEEGLAVATDPTGNVYVTGRFQGVVDFDPGAGQALLTSAGSDDVFVARYSASGGLVWARRVGGSGADLGAGIGVDGAGNVYVGGEFSGAVDFNPGPGSYTQTSAGDTDAFVLKLDSTGTFLWAGRWGGSGADRVTALVVTSAGAAFLTGSFQGTVDFDPGAGSFSLASAGESDIFLTSLNATGTLGWAGRLGGPDQDQGRALALDPSGNLILAGSFEGRADFDPAANNFEITSGGGSDAFVSKFTSAGAVLWAHRLGDSGTDLATSVAVDPSGNVYTAGTFQGNVDFDPDATATFTLSSAGAADIFVTKVDPFGRFSWADRLGDVNADDVRGLAADSNGSVYLTGSFSGTIDFDPGSGTFSLTSAGLGDQYIGKLDTLGRFAWAIGVGGVAGTEAGRAIVLDGAGGLVSTGSFRSTGVDFDPTGGGDLKASHGGSDLFVTRLTQPSITGRVWLDDNGNGRREGGEAPAVGVRVELFDSVDGVSGNSDDRSLMVATTAADGSYQFVGAPLSATGYYVAISPPSGWAVTQPDQGDDGLDSDFGALTGHSELFTPGTNNVELDAGLTDISSRMALTLTGQSVSQSGVAYSVSATGTDAQGNLYVIGQFSGTVDFDPGSGVVSNTSNGSDDAYVSKLDAAGNLLWVRAFGGSDSDTASTLVVGGDGSVYVTGSFSGTVDFDSGPGVANRTSNGGRDVFVSKLDAAGNLLWVRAFGGSSNDDVHMLVVGGEGGVYLAGSFSAVVDFDPGPGVVSLSSNGSKDAYVSKLDASGSLLWARAFGGSGDDDAPALAVSGDGSVYLAGTFRGTVDFDPGPGEVPLTSNGDADAYVSKLDASGNLLWARAFGGNSNDTAKTLVVGGDGSVYLTGSFSGTVDFDPGPGEVSLPSNGYDAYVSKLDASGSLLWARAFGGTSSDDAPALAVGGDGSVYLAGTFWGTVDFDPGPGEVSLTSNDWYDAYVSKLDASGSLLWARAFGGTGNDTANTLAVGGDGSIYLAGSFWHTVDFDPGPGLVPLTSNGWDDAYVSKLDASGSLLWARAFGGIDRDIANTLAVGGDGSVYLAGLFSGIVDFDPGPGVVSLTSNDFVDAYVSKLDASGSLLWADTFEPAGGISPSSVAITTDGSIYQFGTFRGTVDFDPGPGVVQFTSNGVADAYVSKLDASGSLLWARAFGGSGDDTARTLVVGGDGSVYLTGSFSGTVDFDPGPGVVQFTSNGVADAYVSKLDASGSLLWARAFGGPGDWDTTSPVLAVGGDGSVYLAGTFSNIVDFDPGPGEVQLTSTDWDDAYVSKLDASGSLLWARAFGGIDWDTASTLAVGGDGSVYLAGTFRGTVDFDPGPGVVSLTGNGWTDAYVSKLDASGSLLWARAFGGIDWDTANTLAVGGDGSVYLAGSFSGTVDFDPGLGEVQLTSNGRDDAYVSKLDASGSLLWVRAFGGIDWDTASTLAVGGDGSVYLAGTFWGTVDFDPGPGVVSLTGNGRTDTYVSKLDTSGSLLWARAFGGTGVANPTTFAVGGNGSLFLGGTFTDTMDVDSGRGHTLLDS